MFRHRVWLIAGAFFAATFLAHFLANRFTVPFGSWMALDPRLRLGAQGPLGGAPTLQLLAPTLLFVAGMALRAWGTSYLRGNVMLDKRLHTERLIVAGPFRWCRNPLYLGNVLFAAGFGLYLPPPGLLLAVAGMGAAVGVVAAAEAKALRRVYGAEYDAYARAVPMFLPRPPPKGLLRGTPVRPDWRNGLATELWQLIVGAYLACLALRQQVLALALLAVAVAGGVWLRWSNRRAAAKP